MMKFGWEYTNAKGNKINNIVFHNVYFRGSGGHHGTRFKVPILVKAFKVGKEHPIVFVDVIALRGLSYLAPASQAL
jgi:hypothetical protein